MKNISICLTLLLFIVGLPALGQAQSDLDKEQQAREHLFQAKKMMDFGKYFESLERCQTAWELSPDTKTQGEALLAQAALMSIFLDAPEAALGVYHEILAKYPQSAETALFREGLLLLELGRTAEAEAGLLSYKKKYPAGEFLTQTETLLGEIKKMPSRTAGSPGEGPLPPVAPLGSSPQVRVCLCLTDGEATIRGTQATPIQASDLESKDSFKIKAAGNQLFVNGLPSKQKKITFQSDSPLGINCGIKRKQVRGRLVAGLEDGKLLIVNLVDLEDYLFSAVTSDANSSWPLDTLKAQAVIARTYALYQQLHRQDLTYDLVDDEGEQIYSGTSREHPKGRQAVRETKGTIISYQGRPILAVRNSNSGGYTADSGEIFGLPKPYLVAQPDPESLNGKMARWQRKITPPQIEAALAAKGLKITGLKDINPAVKGTCGRVIKISLVSANGT
ncbi:MAG: SpoIID/LytB domain-containing protein, partial [Deltaproteobacteria bacterium]|nr:SpoIID/LytB domain-containing protein [Deltaproteobacteria bacterium]